MSRTCQASVFFCLFTLVAGACPQTGENAESGQEATAADAGTETGNTSGNQVGGEAGASGAQAAAGSGGGGGGGAGAPTSALAGSGGSSSAGAPTSALAGSGGSSGAGAPTSAPAGSGGSSGSQAGQRDDLNGAAQSCVVGGCSNQLCTDAASGPVVSTCEWTEAYGCYRSATCERQSSGQCGWRQTPELMQCLNDAGQP